ncbi:PqqD family protein [bacterium CPR1]|nr:PqqD family protein [bacterium CPR1]
MTTLRRSLAGLTSSLQAAGYEAPALRPILKRGILDITPELLPALVRRCQREGSPAARLIAFWLLLEPAPRCEMVDLMGSEALETLVEQGLVQEESGTFRARASLYPLLGGYYLADPVLSPGNTPWLSAPEYALALTAPRTSGEEAVDLNPGCGVQTVLNAGHHRKSWGRRVTPLSLLNALLNDREDSCRFAAMEEVIPGTFHLITARLPFLSEDSPLVSELAQRLEVGGTLALAVRQLIPDQPLLDRAERWLGGQNGWGLAQLEHSRRALSLKTPLSDLGFDMAGLQAGFQGAAESLLFIRRLESSRPGWRTCLTITPPQKPISDLVDAWLEAQERFSQAPPLASWRPRWSYTERLFLDSRSGLGYADFTRGFQSAVLDPASAFLLNRSDGTRSAEELVKACAEEYALTRSQAAESLAELGRRVLVV